VALREMGLCMTLEMQMLRRSGGKAEQGPRNPNMEKHV